MNLLLLPLFDKYLESKNQHFIATYYLIVVQFSELFMNRCKNNDEKYDFSIKYH